MQSRVVKPRAQRMPADPHFKLTPLPAPDLYSGPSLDREEGKELYLHIDGGGPLGELADPSADDDGMHGGHSGHHHHHGIGGAGEEYALRVGSSKPQFGRTRRSSAPSSNTSKRLASMAAAVAGKEGVGGDDGMEVEEADGSVAKPQQPSQEQQTRSSSPALIDSDTGTGPNGHLAGNKRSSLTRSLSSDTLLRLKHLAEGADGLGGGGGSTGTNSHRTHLSHQASSGTVTPTSTAGGGDVASPAASTTSSSSSSTSSRISRAFGHMFGFGKPQAPTTPTAALVTSGGRGAMIAAAPGGGSSSGVVSVGLRKPSPLQVVTGHQAAAAAAAAAVSGPTTPVVLTSSPTAAAARGTSGDEGHAMQVDQPPTTAAASAVAPGGAGSGILRKLSHKLGSAGGGGGSGGGGSPPGSASASAAARARISPTTSLPQSAGDGSSKSSLRILTRPPSHAYGAGASGAGGSAMTAGSEDYKTAETVDATAAPSRPTPEQEVAMVNAFIVAKRKAAKALEQGYNITGPLAVAVAPGAGAGGAASGGKAPDRTSEDGKDKQPQQQVMSLADFSGTNVAEAAAALSPGEVTSVMAEIEEEQLSDAKALVSALNPVVLEAFEVTADTLTTALTAEARRRARLRTLFEVRRSRSSIDLTAYGPSTIEDDETLALIDGDSSGLGCSLLVGRKLRLNDEPWRKVVREVSKLPAFLGVVLFQRAVEASVTSDAETALLEHGCVQLRAGAEPERVMPWQTGAGGGGGLTRIGSTLSPTAVAVATAHAHHAHNRSFFFGAAGGGAGADGAPPPPLTGPLPRRASDIGFTGTGISGIGHARTMTLARTLSATHGFGSDDARPMSPRLRYAHGVPLMSTTPSFSFNNGASAAAGGGGGGGGNNASFYGVSSTGTGTEYGTDPTTWNILYPLNPEEAYMRRANERIRAAVRVQALSGTIGVVDFLRVWLPALDDSGRSDKLMALLNPSPDPVLCALTLEIRTEIRRQMRTLKKSVTKETATAPGTGTGAPPSTTTGAVGAPGGTTAGSRRQMTSTVLPDVSADAAAAAGGAETTTKILAMVRMQKLALARKLLAAGLTSVAPPIRLIVPSPDFPSLHRVAGSDLAPCIEALVERHPDLASLREKPMQRGRYLTCVLSAVFASLPQGLSLQGVPVSELRHSNLADSLWLCSTTSTVGIAPYSLRFFQGLESDFESAAQATKFADDKEAAAKLSQKAGVSAAAAHLRKRSEFGFDLFGAHAAAAAPVATTGTIGGRPPASAASLAKHHLPTSTGGEGSTAASGGGGGLHTRGPSGLTIKTDSSSGGYASTAGAGGGGGGDDDAVHVVHSPDLLFATGGGGGGGNDVSGGGGGGGLGTPYGGGGLGSMPSTPRNSRAAQKKLRMPDPDPGADDKATVSMAAFQRQCDVMVTQTVLERVFMGIARPLMSGIRGRIAWEDFVWLACMQHQRMTTASQEYWLRCLDLDDDGFLGQQDLAAAFQAKASSLAASGKLHVATAREAMAILMDAINPSNPERGVTRLDIKRSGCGPILFDMLVSATQPRSITAAAVNLRMVTSPNAMHGGCGEV